jgi:hypothetical protein
MPLLLLMLEIPVKQRAYIFNFYPRYVSFAFVLTQQWMVEIVFGNTSVGMVITGESPILIVKLQQLQIASQVLVLQHRR